MSQLKKDTQLTLLSRIPVMLLSFLSVVILTRLLGPEGNGVYTFIYAGLNLFITIIGFQLDSSLTFFLANKEYDNKKVFSTVGYFFWISIMAMNILVFLIGNIFPEVQNFFIPEGQPVLFFAGFLLIAFALRSAANLIQAALRGLYQFKAFNFYIIVAQLIPVLVYTGLLFAGIRNDEYPLSFFFKIILASESMVLLIGLILLLRTKELHFSKDSLTYRKPISQYSSKNLLGTIGHFLNKRLDVWFVEFYKGIAMLGQYGLATQMTNFISEALTPFNQVLLPYLSGTPVDMHKEMVGRIARLNLYIALTAGICIAGLSWIFIPLLFGHQFDAAIPATQILSIGIVFISQRLVFTNYFKAVDQIGFTIKASWGGVVMTIILDLLLIPSYGIIGASIASVVAYGTSALFLIYHATIKIGLSATDIILIRKSDIKWLLSRRETIRDI